MDSSFISALLISVSLYYIPYKKIYNSFSNCKSRVEKLKDIYNILNNITSPKLESKFELNISENKKYAKIKYDNFELLVPYSKREILKMINKKYIVNTFDNKSYELKLPLGIPLLVDKDMLDVKSITLTEK